MMRWDRRSTVFVLLTLLLGCRNARPAAERGSGTNVSEIDTYIPRDSVDSALNAPPLITARTVVVFWVHAGDTLNADDAASALEDLNYYTEKVSPSLKAYGITLVPTNADTVYLSLPNQKRRPILLTGLEYPFGYLLIEPGGVERVLAGVYADDELLDEIKAYFDLPDDTTQVEPRITT